MSSRLSWNIHGSIFTLSCNAFSFRTHSCFLRLFSEVPNTSIWVTDSRTQCSKAVHCWHGTRVRFLVVPYGTKSMTDCYCDRRLGSKLISLQKLTLVAELVALFLLSAPCRTDSWELIPPLVLSTAHLSLGCSSCSLGWLSLFSSTCTLCLFNL